MVESNLVSLINRISILEPSMKTLRVREREQTVNIKGGDDQNSPRSTRTIELTLVFARSVVSRIGFPDGNVLI